MFSESASISTTDASGIISKSGSERVNHSHHLTLDLFRQPWRFNIREDGWHGLRDALVLAPYLEEARSGSDVRLGDTEPSHCHTIVCHTLVCQPLLPRDVVYDVSMVQEVVKPPPISAGGCRRYRRTQKVNTCLCTRT